MNNQAPTKCNLLWDRTNMSWKVRDGDVVMYEGDNWPLLAAKDCVLTHFEKRYNVQIKVIYVK